MLFCLNMVKRGSGKNNPVIVDWLLVIVDALSIV
jgi:hypothetical protein